MENRELILPARPLDVMIEARKIMQWVEFVLSTKNLTEADKIRYAIFYARIRLGKPVKEEDRAAFDVLQNTLDGRTQVKNS